MGIRDILDDFFFYHHQHLSLMVVRGYQQNGRGVIPLHIRMLDSPIPFKSNSHANIRISVRQYRRANTLPKFVFESEFYSRIQAYNPNNTGLLVFQFDPGPLSGYLEFSLSSAARIYFNFTSPKLPFNWSAIRPS